MKIFLLFALLLSSGVILAQSENYLRGWRGGDNVLTDTVQGVQKNETLPVDCDYTLKGYVFDTRYCPSRDVILRYGKHSAITDSQGRFALNIKECEDATLFVAGKYGRTWSRSIRLSLLPRKQTEILIMLPDLQFAEWFRANTGCNVTCRSFSLHIPPEAVEEVHNDYDPDKRLSLFVEAALPTDPDFGLHMPGGDFSAIDQHGNPVMLYSYGFISALLRYYRNNNLEMKPGTFSSLRFTLPDGAPHRPDSLPFWRFDEARALWVQQGWTYRNGSVYEALVSCFGTWCVGVPVERAICYGRVVDCMGEPAKSGWVRVGQRHVVADSLGQYASFVPADIPFDVWAVDTLRGIRVTAQEERRLEDLRGRDYDGLALWDDEKQLLSFSWAGNVPGLLRYSINGGRTWTSRRAFGGVKNPPREALVGGVCGPKLRVIDVTSRQFKRSLQNGRLDSQQALIYWRRYIPVRESITSIDLHSCGLKQLNMNKLLNFYCIKELNLWMNRLTELPEEIMTFDSLKVLNLCQNRFEKLPESIGNLRNLEVLVVSENRDYLTLPDGISKLNKLRKLYLSNSRVKSLPASISGLENLEYLELSYNEVESLPNGICGLINLNYLSLDENRLSTLPDCFGNLNRLQKLTLEGNRIEALPENFGNLTRLQKLNLEDNLIEALPESFGNLIQLQELNLQGNRLQALPESTGNLTQLRELELLRNQLSSLPDGIGELKSLQKLWLNSNQLTDLPASIANLAGTLQFLVLSDNPIPVERRAAIQAVLPKTAIYW